MPDRAPVRPRSPLRALLGWVYAQDRFTTRLLGGVVVLGSLVAALTAATVLNPREPLPRPEYVEAPVPDASSEPRAPLPAIPPAAPPAAADHPRAAIVIDDLGQSLGHLRAVAGLGLPVSVAVLPGLGATARTVIEARRLGLEVLLHQPMEPLAEPGPKPGPGAMLTTMDAADLRRRLRENLAVVPGAVGVNNHMGSKFMEDPRGVAVLMEELAGRGLFWLDSRTSSGSLGERTARDRGIPAIARDVFLDSERSPEHIRGQVLQLLELARLRGRAVGIGHPYPETLAVLDGMRDDLAAAGVELVPLSRLVPGLPAPVAIPGGRRAGAAVAGEVPSAAAAR